MRRARRTIVTAAFTLVSCSSSVVPAATPTLEAGELRIFTTTATAPLLHDLTTGYVQAHPGFTFESATGDYTVTEARIMVGEPAYFLSNHLPEASDLWAAPVGQDGIAVIVHPENPVAGLSVAQLRDIYQGHTANWRELSGRGGEIVVFSREDGSGTRAEFERLVMGDRRTTRSARLAPSSAAMVLSVARQPGGIGYVSLSHVEQVRVLAINGVQPTADNVYRNRYPLRSTIFMIGLDEPKGDYRAFVGWVQSPAGQAVIARRYAPLLRPS